VENLQFFPVCGSVWLEESGTQLVWRRALSDRDTEKAKRV